MPRLIAIDGPETGLALPVGPESYLAPGPDRRVKLLRGGAAPGVGAAIRAGSRGFRIERLGPAGAAAGPLLVNGEEVDVSALAHGDIVTFAGTTLIFDCDDHAGTETTPGEARKSARLTRPRVPTPPPLDEDSDARAAPPSPDGAFPLSPGGKSIRYRVKAYDDPHALVRSVAPKDSGTRRLATLLEISAAVSATLDLGPLLRTLLDLIFREVPADRGTILLLDPATKKLRSMVTKAREGLSEADGPAVSRTIIREALRSRESILTLDAMTDERFRLGESVAAAQIRSAVCVPIVRSGRVLGVVHLDTMEETRAFTREDVHLLTGIASMAALAIENAKLFQEAAERERLRYELSLASNIQQRLLPKAQPSTPDLDVFGTMVPAKELGGDYFDFVEEPARGGLHVFVGDVSGKGVGAGLIMAIARSYFRPLARAYDSPRRVLAEVNRLLYNDTNREIFMSAVYLRWDGGARRLVYSGAGQEHLLILRAKGGGVEAVPAGGVALALVEEAEEYLEDRELPLAPGDAIVLYSDGVTEARNLENRFFGLERLTALLREVGPGAGAREIVERIVAAVKAFQASGEQHDDITVVALKRR